MESNALQATIIDGMAAKAVRPEASVDVSRANVDFIVGDRPKFADETAGLLRSRLRAASFMMTVILSAAFLSSLVGEIDSFWLLRLGILLVVAVSWNVLRSRRSLSSSQLRIIESIVFGVVVLQLSLMMHTLMGEYAVKSDEASVIGAKYRFMAAWCILILIYDYGHTEDGTFYYVMELLPGLTLEDLVERYGPLSPERVVYLLRQVCGALHEAHGVGLIHRDIKPANIFAAQRGGMFDVAKLQDFGLVKERTATSVSEGKSSASGSFSGTPLYMAPERAMVYDDVDGRADLYSLGAVGYYLLTGQPPFTGTNVVQLLAAHASKDVAAPSTIKAGIPGDVEQVILKCLAKGAIKPIPRCHQPGTIPCPMRGRLRTDTRKGESLVE